MLAGELYFSFTPELIAARERCHRACRSFNTVQDASRRQLIQMWKEYVQLGETESRLISCQSIVDDKTPIPEDEADLEDEPYVEAPVAVDHGTNLK
jgi:hypothetical protein